MSTTTSAPTATDTLNVVLALSHLLPEGYSLRYAAYDDPAMAAIQRFTLWFTPKATVTAGADFRARCVARRTAEANRRQVGVIVADDAAGTAWEAYRPSTARTAIGGLRTVGRWRYLNAAIDGLVRIDRRRPVTADRWRLA
jgi:hypothetical protein